MSIVNLDIETIPQQPEDEAKAAIAETISAPAAMKKQETIDAWHNGDGKYAGEKDAAIEKAYRDTSFDGSKGQIVSMAYCVGDGSITGIGAGASDSIQTELDVIEAFFHALLVEIGEDGRAPLFVGHYIGGFDLKFLLHRCIILGVKPPFSIPAHGRHDKDFFDTMTAWAGFKDRISQDNLCKALGIEGKPSDITGANVWDHVKAGNIKRVVEYNIDDVKKNREIYKRLNFIDKINH